MRNTKMTDSKRKPLTGIREVAQGYIGAYIQRGTAGNGSKYIKFDLCCNTADESRRQLVTWRHCIAYRDKAEKLADLKPGDLARVMGWIVTENTAQADEPVQKRDKMILYHGEIQDKEQIFDYQPRMDMSLPTGQKIN